MPDSVNSEYSKSKCLIQHLTHSGLILDSPLLKNDTVQAVKPWYLGDCCGNKWF